MCQDCRCTPQKKKNSWNKVMSLSYKKLGGVGAELRVITREQHHLQPSTRGPEGGPQPPSCCRLQHCTQQRKFEYTSPQIIDLMMASIIA